MAHAKGYPILPSFKNHGSHVQLLRRLGNRRIWGLGTAVILKENPVTPAETPFDELAILEFLQQNTQIPVPTAIAEWHDDENNVHFSLKKKIKGESLEDLWPTLTWKEKERIADEVAGFLGQLRQLTSPYCGRVVEGTGVVDQMLFNVQHPEPQGPFTTQDELWEAMMATLKGQIPEKALGRLRAQMPDCLPWTYTHGDLSLGNFIIRDSHVVGMLDWEWSGWFPCWWEYAKFRGGVPRWVDPDWWELVEYRMEKHDEAYEFWDKFHSLVYKVESASRSVDPRKIKIGNAVLEELLDNDASVGTASKK